MRVKTSDMMLGFNRNDRPWESEMHYHERSKEIYIILKGGLTLRIGDQSVQVKSGQMLVVKEGAPHDIEDFDLPIELITIRLPRSRTRSLSRSSEDFPPKRFHMDAWTRKQVRDKE